jgi:hypothetical protein
MHNWISSTKNFTLKYNKMLQLTLIDLIQEIAVLYHLDIFFLIYKLIKLFKLFNYFFFNSKIIYQPMFDNLLLSFVVVANHKLLSIYLSHLIQFLAEHPNISF